MVDTEVDKRNIFLKVEHIYLTDTKMQVWGYFGLESIGNVTRYILEPLSYHAFNNMPGVVTEEQS